MGDLIGITVQPRERSTYYKVPSGGLKIYIKANSGNAAIGLTMKKDNDCVYWIVLGHNGRTWIKKSNGCYSKIVRTSNILSPDEYRGFWLMWNAFSIKLGRDGETDPITSFSDPKAKHIQYVLFAAKGGDSPVHWKFELRPMIPKLDLRPVTGGEVRWVQANNQLPDRAVIGGYENGALYIMRAEHNGSLIPGKFVPSEGVGYIPWDAQSHEKRNFEILVGFNCTWVHTREDTIPVGAIVGGYCKFTKEKVYIGRARHNGHLIPGNFQPCRGACFIPYKSIAIQQHHAYEILVGSDSNKHCLKAIWTLMVRHCFKTNVRRKRIPNKMINDHLNIAIPRLSNDEYTEDEEDLSE